MSDDGDRIIFFNLSTQQKVQKKKVLLLLRVLQLLNQP